MALPFLPGNSFNPNIGKTKFHLSHHFDTKNDVGMWVGETKPGVGGDALPSTKPKHDHSTYPSGENPNQPAWVAFDKQVLSFEAFYQEAVHERREEQFRVRKCKIFFYLEDDSVQVIEPREKNSGLPQGTLIRRHRIPLPAPNEDHFYRVEHFNVGTEVMFYGKKFKIASCDPFTENFLRKLGVKVGGTESIPDDPYMSFRKKADGELNPLRPYERRDKLRQFLDHDRQVLRFWGSWDDTSNLYGDLHEMIVHYYLADDTIELKEVLPANSGRENYPKFLQRGKLPKQTSALLPPGTMTDRTVLNVLGAEGRETGSSARYLLDALKTGAVNPEAYSDADLRIGTTINVYGRKLILVDCDDFTKEYYRKKFGIEDFTPLRGKARDFPCQLEDSSAECAGSKKGEKEWPPYNGFGSEEDSLNSCKSLLPNPPKHDFHKFMLLDRDGYESHTIRFLARIVTDHPVESTRSFVISFFLSDDTILIFEPPKPNTGIIGGKFLERGRVKKPGQPRYNSKLPDYYNVSDLYVGANIVVNGFCFNLIDADEYAYSFMERNPQQFPCADIAAVMGKLAGQLAGQESELHRCLAQLDPDNAGYVLFDNLAQLLRETAGSMISEHEIRTVGRYYGTKGDGGVDSSTLAGVLQNQLRKKNFDSFTPLRDALIQEDRHKCGMLDHVTVRRVIKANRVPLPEEMLSMLMQSLSDENGFIPYGELVNHINWRDCPAALAKQQASMASPAEWVRDVQNAARPIVNYRALAADLFKR